MWSHPFLLGKEGRKVRGTRGIGVEDYWVREPGSEEVGG